MVQQLYMIPTFRKAIIEIQDPHIDVTPPLENALYQFKRIFGGLMEIEKEVVVPRKFCMAFKDIDGNPVNVDVQRDVDEFCITLMDRVE